MNISFILDIFMCIFLLSFSKKLSTPCNVQLVNIYSTSFSQHNLNNFTKVSNRKYLYFINPILLSGHILNTAFPTISSSLIKPLALLSADTKRLSPSTKYVPSGTVS